MMKECCPIEQTSRQERLEELYKADGRHDKGHPHHGLYTGLHLAAQGQEVGQ